MTRKKIPNTETNPYPVRIYKGQLKALKNLSHEVKCTTPDLIRSFIEFGIGTFVLDINGLHDLVRSVKLTNRRIEKESKR